MQERMVSIDRETYHVPANFTVFATQNPIEYEGTYPLPEAQKDRFMLKIAMQCPEKQDELALAQRMLGDDSPEAVLSAGRVQNVITSDALTRMRKNLNGILIKEESLGYLVEIVRATRSNPSVLVGAGPRACPLCILTAI